MTTHPVDEIIAPPKLFALGLQHVLVMYAGAIAVPLIVGRALKLDPADVAFLISADLFACGIATLIQSLGATQWFGIKLPVMMGVTFASVGPMVAIGTTTPGAEGARAIFGAIIAAGVISILIAPLVSRMLRFFPPVVTGTIILVIGVSLMRIGINWIFGNPVGPTAPMIIDPAHADWLKAVTDLAATGAAIPEVPPGLALAAKAANPAYAPLGNIAISAIVLLAILAIARFGRGFVANISVLLGIVIGGVLATILGKMAFDKVGEAAWFGLITPFHFGTPTFDPVMIITMTLVMVVVMIESTGMFLALGDITGKKITRPMLSAGPAHRWSWHPDRRDFQHLPLHIVQPERRACRRHRHQVSLRLRGGRGDPDRAGPDAQDGRAGRGFAPVRPWRGWPGHVRHGRGDGHPYPVKGGFCQQPQQPVRGRRILGVRHDPPDRAKFQTMDAA